MPGLEKSEAHTIRRPIVPASPDPPLERPIAIFRHRTAISSNWKGETYDSILVIADRLTKMEHYEPVKVTIDAPALAEVIIDVVVRHHGLPDSIVSDRGPKFMPKFFPPCATS